MTGDADHGTFATRGSIFLRLNATEARTREMAWEEFRRRHAPVIAGFARNLGAKPQDVDDVIQDVMLGFFAKSPTFVYDPAKGRFRGYLPLRDIFRGRYRTMSRGVDMLEDDRMQDLLQ